MAKPELKRFNMEDMEEEYSRSSYFLNDSARACIALNDSAYSDCSFNPFEFTKEIVLAWTLNLKN